MTDIKNTYLAKRTDIIHFFQSHNDDKQNDKWNLSEIAQHCFLIEEYTLNSILNFSKERSILNNKQCFKSILLLFALRTNFKFKIPTKAIKPNKNIEKENILLKWKALSTEWENVIERFRDQKNIAVFYHPFAGKMNLAFTLLFIIYHHNHHIRQVD